MCTEVPPDAGAVYINADILSFVLSHVQDMAVLLRMRSVCHEWNAAMRPGLCADRREPLRLAPVLPPELMDQLHERKTYHQPSLDHSEMYKIVNEFTKIALFGKALTRGRAPARAGARPAGLHLDAATNCVALNHVIATTFFRYDPALDTALSVNMLRMTTASGSLFDMDVAYEPGPDCETNEQPIARRMHVKFQGSGEAFDGVFCYKDEHEPLDGFMPVVENITSLALCDSSVSFAIPFSVMFKVFTSTHLVSLQLDHSMCNTRTMAMLSSVRPVSLLPALDSLTWRHGRMTARMMFKIMRAFFLRPRGLKHLDLDHNFIGATFSDYVSSDWLHNRNSLPSTAYKLNSFSLRYNSFDRASFASIGMDLMTNIHRQKQEMRANAHRANIPVKWTMKEEPTHVFFYENMSAPDKEVFMDFFKRASFHSQQRIYREYKIPVQYWTDVLMWFEDAPTMPKPLRVCVRPNE